MRMSFSDKIDFMLPDGYTNIIISNHSYTDYFTDEQIESGDIYYKYALLNSNNDLLESTISEETYNDRLAALAGLRNAIVLGTLSIEE